jgi:hypothetical protein
MRDDQIAARLRVLHPNLARLFELARAAQRKPSRRESLLTRAVAEAFGDEGIVLHRGVISSSSRAELQQLIPDAVRDLALTVFGEERVTVETAAQTTDCDEFTLKLALTNLDATQYANIVHEVTVFLTGLARLDRYSLHGYWSEHNPELAERSRRNLEARFAALFSILGGYQNILHRH